LTRYLPFLAAAALLTVLSSATVTRAQDKKDKHEDKKEVSCPMMKQMGSTDKSHPDTSVKKKENTQSFEASDDQSKHHNHLAMIQENGEKAMGFSQTATTHHFLLMKDGGVILVEANDSADTKNRKAIRSHLAGITLQFSEGIFTTPFAVHGQIPPGVSEMERLKQDINYRYEETGMGAQVRISTDNPKALAAIHDFLKFQIKEHRTGDRASVEN
jgi:hypothetical protein